jgi:gluconolactonase
MSGWKWLIALSALAGLAGAAPEPPDNPIFSPDAALELVFTRSAKLNSGLTEGPAAAPDGSIYFTDMPFGLADQTMIHRLDPRTGKTTVFTDRAGKANGLTFDARGDLLACDGADGGGRSITRWNLASGRHSVVADRYQGKRFNSPNDLCVGAQGRIYFTDPRYVGEEPRELMQQAVYCVDTDGPTREITTGEGAVREVTHEVEMPNGIVLSPDQRTLYVGDHNNGGNRKSPTDPPPPRGAMKLYAFPLGDDGLVSGPRRTLVDFAPENGCDGITIDSKGNIYISCRSLARPGLMIVDPQGKKLAFLPTGPTQQTGGFDDWRGIPSNVEFGPSTDGQTAMLYVTVDRSLYRVPVKQTGARPAWSKP